jgi:hypothetical protein
MKTPEEFLKAEQIEDCELQVGNVVLLSYPPQVPVKKLSQLLTDFASQSKPQEIPEENRQKLFNHMSTEHGLTLLESEMNSIYSICIGHEEYVKYLNWLHSKPEEIEFVKSKDQDGDDLISWKTLSGLYNIIIHNESIGVSFIPFDSNQKSQLIHHDFTRNTKTVDAVEWISVKEKLWDRYQAVWATDGKTIDRICTGNIEGTLKIYSDITHWTPIIKPNLP